MYSIRAASFCFIVTLVIAPLPADAQTPPPALATRVTALEAAVAALQNSLNAETGARAAADTTLQAQIDTLNGSITATDLEGTYNLYFVATDLDPAEGGVGNIISSYVITGTVTLGTDGIGSMTAAASGRALNELPPDFNWLGTEVSGGPAAGQMAWRYNNGKVDFEIGIGGIAIPFHISLTPAAGGQVMVGAKGGPPDYNQNIIVLTRQP
jgi:hypothetical protein